MKEQSMLKGANPFKKQRSSTSSQYQIATESDGKTPFKFANCNYRLNNKYEVGSKEKPI